MGFYKDDRRQVAPVDPYTKKAKPRATSAGDATAFGAESLKARNQKNQAAVTTNKKPSRSK